MPSNSMAAAPAKRLKVGLVLDGGLERLDGVQQYILAVGGWLRSQGHDARYLVAGPVAEGITGAHSLAPTIPVRFNGNGLWVPLPASKRKLRRFLEAEQFDILHVQTPYSPMMGEKLIKLAGPRTAVVGTFHILPNSWISSTGNRLLGMWCKRSLRRFDRMLAVSPAAADFCQRSFRVKAEVVPNVVDFELFHNAQPLTKYSDDKQTILFLGRLMPRKGCMLLLQAVARLSDVPPFRVVICGRGPLEASLKQFVKTNHLDDKVEFTGFISEQDKPHYYASADLSVFPSSGGESFGIVLLEAMASGKAAVLAGDNPGYRSVMAPQEDLLFDPTSTEALQAKLEFYLRQVAARQQMAAWGADYTAKFDINKVGARIESIYAQALRKSAQL